MNTEERNNIKKILPDYFSDGEKEEATRLLIELAEIVINMEDE